MEKIKYGTFVHGLKKKNCAKGTKNILGLVWLFQWRNFYYCAYFFFFLQNSTWKFSSYTVARNFFGVSFDSTISAFWNFYDKNCLFNIVSTFSGIHTRYFGFSKYYVIWGGGGANAYEILGGGGGGGGQNFGFLYYVICGRPIWEGSFYPTTNSHVTWILIVSKVILAFYPLQNTIQIKNNLE